MAIAQIEVQVKRNPMKTLAQIINLVNNLGLRRFFGPGGAPKDGLDQASHKQPWKQSGSENLPRYLALSKLEVLYESPKRERVSQGIQGWDTVLPHRSRLTFQYVDRSRQ
jgi:hypothetical protein